MQTQSISQGMSLVQARTAGKTAKSGNSSFDSFMAQNTPKTEGKNNDRLTVRKADPKSGSGAKDIGSSRDDFNQNRISLKDGSKGQEMVENVELDEVETAVVQFLGNTFGLSEEDVIDILEQLGMTPIDLVLFMAQDTVAIRPVNVENIKAFIMEVHGVDDESLFLMSDQMSGELSDTMSGIEDILSKELGTSLADLLQEDPVIMQSFAEKLGQVVNNAGGKAQETAVAEEAEPDVMVQTAGTGAEDEIPVIVEMSGESETPDAFQGESQGAAAGMDETAAREIESPLGAFVERLTASFENARQEETVSPQVTMADIVEQVVHHVRIRVLPQTTSMELQLNPESLGRVNLNVTSQNGTATATLTVQNQVAKEALESQITVLRENLESQGLKVDAVEVNVSEFGFKHPGDSDTDQKQQNKSSQNRRFRFDSAEEADERESAVTDEDRQDGNSVVDYTA